MSKYQHAQLKITTLSPLHIGNGEQLSPVGEFFTTQENVYFLDNDKLISTVKNLGKLDEYIQIILKEGIGLDFYKTLKEWDIDPKEFSKREINLNQTGLLSTHNNILHQCIKTNQQAYIPGSSLKGLFRTAMICHFFLKNTYELKKIEQKIREKLYDRKKELSKLWNRIESQYFPDFIFHALRLMDSSTLDDKHLVIEQMSRVPFYESDGEGVDWLTESIQPKQVLESALTILPKMEKERIDAFFNHKKNRDLNQDDFQISNWVYLKKKGISKIISIVNSFSSLLIDFEIGLLQKTEQNKNLARQLIQQLNEYKQLITESENKYAIARIGKGKTLFFQSILPILSEDIKEAIINFYRKEHQSGFPRTRVLSVKDKEMAGWIKIDFDIQKVVRESPQTATQTIERESVIEKKLKDNSVKQLTKGTVLDAVFIELKKVEIMINGQAETYQLINKFRKSFPKNKPVKVIVHQLSKAGKIIQVKLKS